MTEPLQKLKLALGPLARENEPLARYTTFKVGGPADLFFEARTTDEFTRGIRESRSVGIPVFVLGGGSNILIGDKGIRGLVIKNATSRIAPLAMKGNVHIGERRGTVYLEVDSGVPINKLVRQSIEEGMSGLEMHLGLPGTVGGAVYMNSKWTHPDGYVGDAVYQATIVTKTGDVTIVPQKYFHFAYDSSTLQTSGDIVISVVFALLKDDRDRLWKIANESVAYRRQTQPHGVSSAGCTFRNITRAQAMAIPTPRHTTSAGFLVDHAGLKGLRIGDAEISKEHANFIVNLGKARASDVVELIERAREQVKRQFGFDLEEEIVRVGEF